jgi:uncharacterized membrane protein YjdF
LEQWFLRIAQMLIVIAVSGSAAAFEWTENPQLMGVWGIIAAIGFTLAYTKVTDWLSARGDRRRQRARL